MLGAVLVNKYPKLLSSYGSFVGFDAAVNKFIVCKDCSDKRIVKLFRRENKAILLIANDDGSVKYLSPSIPNVCVTDNPDTIADWWDVFEQFDGISYLHFNNRFLSVHSNDQVAIEPWMERDERFWLLYDTDIAARLLSDSWFSKSLNRVIQKGEIEFSNEFRLRIGEIIYLLDDIKRFGFADGDKTFNLIYDKFKVEQLERYRPLFYTCAFGTPQSFELLKICIASVEEFGGHNGDYLIITDRNQKDIEELLNFIDRSRIKVYNMPAVDVIDMVAARYKAANIKSLDQYQPVIYCDNDMVCNDSIEGIFLASIRKKTIFIRSEGAIDQVHYGAALIQNDSHMLKCEKIGFNSGLFAFSNFDIVRTAFKLVVASMSAHLRHGLDRYNTSAYDQSPANYVFNKFYNFDLLEMEKFVHPWPPIENESITGNGLIHFCGGVGADHKVDRVQSYYSYVQQTKQLDKRNP